MKISVRVDNKAGISAKKLRFAESEAAKIYAKAGVDLEWHECPATAHAESADFACATPLTPSDLRLRIVDSVKLKGVHATSEASGYAIGDLALVQLQYLQGLPTPSEYFRDMMLGRVIAHEIGHALLGPEHSSQGIMQARWGDEQLLRAASELVFTPDQEKALRMAVTARRAGKARGFPNKYPGTCGVPRKMKRLRAIPLPDKEGAGQSPCCGAAISQCDCAGADGPHRSAYETTRNADFGPCFFRLLVQEVHFADSDGVRYSRSFGIIPG